MGVGSLGPHPRCSAPATRSRLRAEGRCLLSFAPRPHPLHSEKAVTKGDFDTYTSCNRTGELGLTPATGHRTSTSWNWSTGPDALNGADELTDDDTRRKFQHRDGHCHDGAGRIPLSSGEAFSAPSSAFVLVTPLSSIADPAVRALPRKCGFPDHSRCAAGHLGDRVTPISRAIRPSRLRYRRL